MITGHLIAALLPTAVRSMRRWLFHLGGIGLIPLGLLDSSLIPLPGIMDVATIVLSARQQELWLYYALMATAGSVIGGFVTYRLARKGGKEALEHRFSPRKVDKVCEIFGRWGFGAIAIPAFLPPPMPMVPFLLAAGAMQYPPRKFLAALTLGRISRYLILAYLTARYGRRIIAFIAEQGHPFIVGIIVVLMATVAVLFYFLGGKKSEKWTWKLGGRSLLSLTPSSRAGRHLEETL
jgi:membrane protein YqaA with SNARE-associated domain